VELDVLAEEMLTGIGDGFGELSDDREEGGAVVIKVRVDLG
jgi:hypothetical protein